MTLASHQQTASSANHDADSGRQHNSRPAQTRRPSDAIPPTLLRLPDLDPEESAASDFDSLQDSEVSRSDISEKLAIPSGTTAGTSPLVDSLYKRAIVPESVVGSPEDVDSEVEERSVLRSAESDAGDSNSASFLATFASRKALLVLVAVFAGLAIFVPRSNSVSTEQTDSILTEPVPSESLLRASNNAPLNGVSSNPRPSNMGSVNTALNSTSNHSFAASTTTEAGRDANVDTSFNRFQRNSVPPKVAFDRNVPKPQTSLRGQGVSPSPVREMVRQPNEPASSNPTHTANQAVLIERPVASNPPMPSMSESASIRSGLPIGTNSDQPNDMPSLFETPVYPAASVNPNLGFASSGYESPSISLPVREAEPVARLVQSRTPNSIMNWKRFLPRIPSATTGTQPQANRENENQPPVAASQGVRTSSAPTEPDFQFALPNAMNSSGPGSSGPGQNASMPEFNASSAPEARVAMPPSSYRR